MDILLVAISVSAVIAALFSVWYTMRADSPGDLKSKLHRISLDVDDLYERMERRDKSEAGRRSREAKAAVAEPHASVPIVVDRKTELRRRAFNNSKGTEQ